MFYSLKAKLAAAMFTGAALAGCVNDGTVADKHAITFEKQLPANPPSQAQLAGALNTWIVKNFADGNSARDVSNGPVRYANLLIPLPGTDFFTCSQFTAKNQYGTYMPPIRQLTMYRDYGNGYSVGFVKQPGTGAYDQYCISQPHG